MGEKIVYFYGVDSQGSLVGVVPTRRFLTAPWDPRLSEVMIRQVVTIPQGATVLDAFGFSAIHRYLAFPVLDQKRHIMGVATRLGPIPALRIGYSMPGMSHNFALKTGLPVSDLQSPDGVAPVHQQIMPRRVA